jgi:hypothetical protein
VLLSTESEANPSWTRPGADPVASRVSSCFLAFSNVQAWGNRLRELGFNCVEAKIGVHEATIGEAGGAAPQRGPLVVRIPFYPPVGLPPGSAPLTAEPGDSASTGYTKFMTIGGIDFDQDYSPAADTQPRAFLFLQLQTVPEPARPRAELSTREAPAQLGNIHDTLLKSSVTLEVAEARYPNLAPLAQGGTTPGDLNSTGVLHDWPKRVGGGIKGASPVARRPQRNPFGAPTFRFSDVESIGFRVDLS